VAFEDAALEVGVGHRVARSLAAVAGALDRRATYNPPLMHCHFLLPVVLLAAAVAQEPKPITSELGDTGLRMVLPTGFEVRDGKTLGLRFLAIGAVHDGFGANINVTTGPASVDESVDAEAMRREVAESMANVLDGYEVAEHGTRKVLGKTAFWISGRYAQQGRRARNLQVLLPGKPGLWMTFTTTADAFAAESKDFLTAVDSLTSASPPAAAAKSKIVRDGDRLVAADEGFAMVPPAGWSLGDPSLEMGAFLTAVGESKDGFAPNLNVRTDAATAAFDLKVVDKTMREMLPKLLKKADVQDVAACKVAGRAGVFVRAAYEVPAGEVCMLQYQIPGKPKSFVVTFTVSKKTLAQWQPLIEAAVATITVK
jgi:hypothetical protein